MPVAENEQSCLSARLAANKMLIVYTFCVCFNQMAYGIGTNLMGPSLIDLQHIYRTSVEAMSYLASFFALGYMFGSLVAWAMPRLNRQITLTILLMLQAVTLMMMPHCGIVGRLYLVAVAFGFGGGGWDSSNTLWLVEMWPETSAVFFQAGQSAFGVGMIIGPLVVSPFLVGQETNTTVKVSPEERRHLLTYPFAIAGAIQLIVPLILIVCYAIKPYRSLSRLNPRTIRRFSELEDYDEFNDEEERDHEDLVYLADGTRARRASRRGSANRSSSFSSNASPSDLTALLHDDNADNEDIIPWRRSKLLLAALALGSYGAFENSFWSFYAAALQYLPVELSATEAAAILSLAAVTYSAGRLAAAFLSLRVTPDSILAGHYTAILVSLTILYLGRDIRAVLYYGSALLGLSFSAIWPAIFSFTERHLRLTDAICSGFSFITGVLTLSMPLILGDMLKAHPIVLFYVLGGCAGVSATAFLVLRLWVALRPRRRRRRQSSN